MDRNALIEQFRRRIRIDTRSLAVFRVIAGVLIVVDILLRLRNFRFFYTDDGVVPVEVAQGLVPEYAVSVFFFSGEPTITLLLFAIHFVVAIQLILGYYTRFAIVVSFLFVVSVDYRNPIVTSYADVIFRHMLFWAMFMPLGARYSIDALRADGPPPKQYTGLAGMFALAQMMLMYLTNGSHKIPSREAWLSGETMTTILHYDRVAFFLSEYVREFPLFMQFSGIMWYSLMLGSPLLLLFTGRGRYLLATLYAGGHLFLAVTVRIGAFPYAAIMGLMLFFQSRAWDDAAWVASRFDLPVERVVAAVTRQGRHLERRLPHLAISDRIPPTERLRRTATTLVIVIVLVSGIFTVIPNAQTIGVIDEDESIPFEDEVTAGQQTVRLAEPSWRFYPSPISSNRYFVFAGETADGQHVDVFNDRPLQWDRPYADNYKQLETYRHRFYMISVRNHGVDGRESGVVEHYQEYLCEHYEWDGQPLERTTMYYIYEWTETETIDDYRQYDRRAILIDAHGCDGAEPGPVSAPPPEYLEHADSELLEFLEMAEDDVESDALD
ncbi:HTTM domain-containing protein [Natronobeatus ordinarius]|uniref:HTTM domain-containing protein n=1 Tax=Natronobeatus ordinarius TaxID=2963433 RepID=UPI0020CCE816|nr:HTTM domain-containing protein [Natronobeatus ordinarius]